jgi:malate synthase
MPFSNLGGWDRHADEGEEGETGENVLGRRQALMYAPWTKAASVSLICKINIHEFHA